MSAVSPRSCTWGRMADVTLPPVSSADIKHYEGLMQLCFRFHEILCKQNMFLLNFC